ncbi:MAG: arylamine N-acetyltransferase, partial [Planctomycetes bacterium]|nr:arylamine N-acetyltransferase [Planctomycetota bacterium]
MNLPRQSQQLFERYLHLLGISRRQPTREALFELTAAQMMRVPFENVSKLYNIKTFGIRALPGLERYLNGIDKYNFGGTCYTNNYYFYLLLAHLGYEIRLCGADMNNPDVHLTSMVRVEQREYLIDTGYAAPFLEPLPRDIDHDYEVALGRDRYVLRPQDNRGYSRLD